MNYQNKEKKGAHERIAKTLPQVLCFKSTGPSNTEVGFKVQNLSIKKKKKKKINGPFGLKKSKRGRAELDGNQPNFHTVIVMCFKQSNPIQMSWLEILAVFYFWVQWVRRDTS